MFSNVTEFVLHLFSPPTRVSKPVHRLRISQICSGTETVEFSLVPVGAQQVYWLAVGCISVCIINRSQIDAYWPVYRLIYTMIISREFGYVIMGSSRCHTNIRKLDFK